MVVPWDAWPLVGYGRQVLSQSDRFGSDSRKGVTVATSGQLGFGKGPHGAMTTGLWASADYLGPQSHPQPTHVQPILKLAIRVLAWQATSSMLVVRQL